MALETNKPSFGVSGRRQGRLTPPVELAAPKACDHHGRLGRRRHLAREHRRYGDTVRDATNVKLRLSAATSRSVALNQFTPEGKESALEDARRRRHLHRGFQGRHLGSARASRTRMLWAVNPKLVIVHCSGFGAYGDPRSREARRLRWHGHGPYCRLHLPERHAGAAYDHDALLRRLHQQLPVDRSSTLAALHKVERTGQGESIDWAMYEGIMYIEPVLPGRLPERGHHCGLARALATRTSAASASTSATTASWACACTASTRTSGSSRPSGMGARVGIS